MKYVKIFGLPVIALILLYFFVLQPKNDSKESLNNKIVAFSTPEEYNNYIVDLQLESVKSIMLFSDACAEGNRKQILYSYEQFQSQTLLSLEQIKILGDFNGSTELKDAAIKLFAFYVDISQNEYKQILDNLVKNEYSKQDDITVDSLIRVVAKKEEIYDLNFEKAQEKFAEENQLQMVKSN